MNLIGAISLYIVSRLQKHEPPLSLRAVSLALELEESLLEIWLEEITKDLENCLPGRLLKAFRSSPNILLEKMPPASPQLGPPVAVA